MANAPVLYVEDEENDVLIVRTAWKRAGVDLPLQVVTDGEQALRYLAGAEPYANRDTYPLPCLVLLDLNLPLKSGLEVLGWLRSQPQFNTLPVVVYTSSGQESDVSQTRQLGISDFLMKEPSMSGTVKQMQSVKERFLTPNPSGPVPKASRLPTSH